jgi:thiol-disulfide isomerase/thioredoxin
MTLRFAAGLLTALLLTAAAPETLEIGTLLKEYEGAVVAFMEAYKKAPEAEQKAMLDDPAREPRQKFAPRFLAGADLLRRNEKAVPFLLWLVQDGAAADPKLAETAVERLLSEHASSAGLLAAPRKIRWARSIRGLERTERDLTTLLERSPHTAVRAEALLYRGLVRLEAERSADAVADLQQARTAAPGTETARRADEELRKIEREIVGRSAPPLEGPGLASSIIRLQDFRGRVVLVDFWGMWCGPCVGALPELQRLAERFADRPFVILGVNSDADREALRRFLASRKVNWPQILDGSTGGPNASTWGVGDWPTYFLVDGTGKVRSRNLVGADRERSIEELLREIEKPGASGGNRPRP